MDETHSGPDADPGGVDVASPGAGTEAAAIMAGDVDDSGEFVTEPAKLMRLASMAKALLAEARGAPADEAGRERLRDIYHLTIDELCSVLSEDLREELSHMALPLEADETPTADELRIAQAQLVGWLEGLFNGIQAAVMSQQLAAQAQYRQMSQQQKQQLQAAQQPRPGQYL